MSDTEDGQRATLLQRLRGTKPAGVHDLRRRVADLEAEVQESRQLNRRLAELMDVVQELLVPLAQQDQEKVRAYLDSHRHTL